MTQTLSSRSPAGRRAWLLSGIAAIALTAPGLVQAQDAAQAPALAAPAQTAAPADTSTLVVVQGIRKSLANAIRTKRAADQIVDAVSAEDVGKLPDQNVAEGLQRITGVQIGRSLGQGSSVAIRGLPENRYEIDGATLTGNSGNGGVSFDSIPSELFGSLEVIKSPTADMTEGALGGTIRMNTVRPLDLKGLTITGQARADYSDFRKAWDPDASLFIGDKWNTSHGQIGALLDVSFDEESLREDNLEVSSWNRTTFGDLDGNGQKTGATSGPLKPDEVWQPQQIRLTSQEQDRKRLGLLGTLQWKPNSDINLRLTTSYTQYHYAIDSRLLRLDVNQPLANTVSYTRDADGTLSAASIKNVNFITNNFFTPENQDNLTTQFEGSWNVNEKLSVSTLLNIARGRDSVPLQLYPTLQVSSPTTLTYQFNGGDSLPTVTLPTLNLASLASYKLNTVVPQTKDTHNDEDAARFDVKYKTDWGILTDLRAGYRHGRLYVAQFNDNNSAVGSLNQGMLASNAATLLPGAYTTALETGDDFMDGVSGTLPRGWGGYNGFWLKGNTNALLQFSGLTLPVPPDYPSWYKVTTKTDAGYLMGDLGGTLFSIPYTGNVGVRVVSSEVDSGAWLPDAGGVNLVYTVQKNSYTDTLPSLNLAFDVRDDVVVRFAAAKVMSPADPSNLSAATSRNNGLLTESSGNPFLKPFRATQFDLSAEWYFKPGSVLTVAAFYKDVQAFIATQIDLVTLYNPEFQGDNQYKLSHPVNGGNGKVDGLEFDYQNNFTFLPSPFDGLGVQANYTFVDSTTPLTDVQTGEPLPLQNLSKNSYNLVAYYQKYGAEFRLAYNWRSKYLTGTISGSPIYNGDYGQLDGSASYDLSHNLTVFLDAVNITGSNTYVRGRFEEQFLAAYKGDARYTLGIRYKY